jgi:hypothetical protein
MIQHKIFFHIALIIFVIEILIATLFNNTILRPVFGDFLIVILIYSLLRSLTKIKPTKLAIIVMSLVYLVEVLQRFNIRDLLGIPQNTFFDLTLGNSFDWWDIFAYSLGVLVIFLCDKYLIVNNTT